MALSIRFSLCAERTIMPHTALLISPLRAAADRIAKREGGWVAVPRAALSGSWIQSGDLDAHGQAALRGIGEDHASQR